MKHPDLSPERRPVRPWIWYEWVRCTQPVPRLERSDGIVSFTARGSSDCSLMRSGVQDGPWDGRLRIIWRAHGYIRTRSYGTCTTTKAEPAILLTRLTCEHRADLDPARASMI